MKWFRRISYLLAAICIILFAYYRIWFLRQPARQIPHNNHVFVSPANGKVVCVKHWNTDSIQVTKAEMGLLNVWVKDVDTAGAIISIQMDPTNVHYQRAPVDAELLSKNYVKGNFHNAVSMSNDYGIRFENEHNELLFKAESGQKFKVIQIAGFMARRIVDYVNPEEDVKQGDVIGLIKLGSQVTVILPHDVTIKCQTGEVVTDGESVLAEIK